MLFRHHENINSQVQAIDLAGIPPHLEDVFYVLKKSGAKHFAIFGGAVRDANYAALYNKAVTIKDYDLRIWLTADDFEKNTQAFVDNIEKNIGRPVQLTPSAGTNRIRYIIHYLDIVLDISVRSIPLHLTNKPISDDAVAIDRAFDSDIGISSVAIASTMQAYGRPEYTSDLYNKTLTICQHGNLERIRAYLERMQAKFPDHTPAHKNTAAPNL